MFENFSGNSLLIGGLVGGAATIGIVWGHIKSFFEKLYSIFVVTLYTKHWKLSDAVNMYCYDKLKRKNLGNNNTYLASNFYVKNKDAINLVAYEKIDKPMTFWKGWFPLFVQSSESKGNNDHSSDGDNSNLLTIKFLRFTFNSDSFIKDCVDHYNTQKLSKGSNNKRYKIVNIIGDEHNHNNDHFHPEVGREDLDSCFRAIGLDKSEIGFKSEDKPFDKLVYPQDVKDLVKDAEFWYNSKDWYKQRGIKWKLGTLLYGKPGVGKTSLIRSLAKQLDVPIYRFDLSSLNNQDFKKGWDLAAQNVPCLIAMEDFDSVFEGRKNVSCKDKNYSALSFDAILNAIDGVQEFEGIYLCISTNDISKIDPALGGCFGIDKVSLRPGRIDRILYLKEISKENAKELCKRIIPEYSDSWEILIEEGIKNKLTASQFEHKCSEFALKKYFENKI